MQDRTKKERLSRFEDKIDAIATSISKLSASMERGFDNVDVAIDDQRQFTEFAFSRLETKMEAGFAGLEAKMDSGLSRIERKLDEVIDTRRETNKPGD